MKKEDRYYEAMKTRDSRFDGKFFAGVKTTGIYCRPICPAQPKRENVEFFENRLAAEKAGYRPCLRCRPEAAPQSPAWVGKSAVVQRAIKVLHSREMLEFDEDEFASLFGVTARHLRRLFVEEVGKTPKQISFDNRLNLARQLLTETALPITEVAYAAGFASTRRFNDAFKERFKKPPREIRRIKIKDNHALTISVPYRPPFDFHGLYQFYQNHRVGNLETFEDGKMSRVISAGGRSGVVVISNDPQKSVLRVEIQFPDASIVSSVIAKVRGLFDLDSDPVIVANSLEADPEMKKLLSQHPGIRLPSGWDPFETAIVIILGQLVSVEQGRRLVHELIEIAGRDSGLKTAAQTIRLFPTPEDIVAADLTNLKTTKMRKQTLVEFSRALIDKRLSLEPTQNVDEFIADALKIKGIGKWSANNMALRVLRDTNGFPSSDLILARAIELHPMETIEAMSPWRGYAAALLWRSYAKTLQRTKRVAK